MMNHLFCLPLFLALSVYPGPKPLPPAEVEAIVDAISKELQPASDLSGISVPLLHSKKLEKKWGKPQIEKSPGGAYLLRYHDTNPKNPFGFVEILATPEVIPPLSSVPAEKVTSMVNGELGEIDKPQNWKDASVKWKTPENKFVKNLRYFRMDSGGGADGPRDRTDAFSITINGKTGYYVITVESASGATEKQFKALEISE